MKRIGCGADRGSAMVIALCLTLALLIFSLGFLLLPWQEYLLNFRVYRGMVALNLAEAGVDYTCWAISSSGNIGSWSGTSPRTRSVTGFATYANESKGDFDIKAWPTPSIPQDIWLVESTGYAPGQNVPGAVSRTVRALCVPSVIRPFAGMFLGDLHVTMMGNMIVDSYDSRIGEYGDASKPYSNIHRGAPGAPDEGKGDIATNSSEDPAVRIGNNPSITVYGDVMTGPGGTVSDVNIIGTVSDDFAQELPYKSVPAGLSWVVQPGDGVLNPKGGKDVTYEPGNYKFTAIKIASTSVVTFNGPAIVWITGYKDSSITETGSAEIRCNGKVEFYVDAEVSLAGNGITNSSLLPTDCLIYAGEGCTDIDITGSNAFYGAVYAPNAELKLRGSEPKFGAFTAKTITADGGADYHYDEALGDLGLTGGNYTLRYWQEM